MILAILFICLPLDHGGFYPRSRAFIAILTLLFISIKVIFPTGEKYPRSLTITAGIFFAWLIIATVFSTDVYNSLQETIYFFLLAVGFVMGYHTIKDRSIFRPAVWFILGNLLITCFFAIFYFILQLRGEPRAIGRFFQADILGGFLVIFIPLAVMLYLVDKGEVTPYIYLAVSVISIATLFLTFSRGAFLSLIIVAPFILWHARKYVRPGVIALKTLALAVLVVLMVFVVSYKAGGVGRITGQVQKRVDETIGVKEGSGSSSARLDFYRAALLMTRERPLTGVGPGNFGYHYPRFQKRVKFFSRYPHNFYLGLLCQGGIPALLIFLILLYFLVRTVKKSIESLSFDDRFTRPAAYALSMGLVASMFHINLDVDFMFAGVAFVFWVIAGILAGLGQEEPETPQRSAPERILRLVAAVSFTALMFVPFLAFLSNNLREQGEAAVKGGQLEKALALFKKAEQLTPYDNEARRKYADFLHWRGHNEEALAGIDRAAALSPYRARLYETRGRILNELKRPDDAYQSFMHSLSLDPINQVYAYQAIGEYYIKKNEKDKALEILNRVIGNYHNVDIDDLWHFRAIPLKPQLAAIHLARGDIFREKNDYDRAIEDYEISFKLEPNTPALYLKGHCCYLKGEYQKCLDSFLKLLEMQQDVPEAHRYISESYRKLGNEKEAKKHQEIFDRMKKK